MNKVIHLTSLDYNICFADDNFILGKYVNGDLSIDITDYLKKYPIIQNEKEILEYNDESEGIYVNILSELTVLLNTKHDEKFSSKSWEIVIGPWLKFWIDCITIRYFIIKQIKSAGFKNIYCLCNKDNSTLFTPPNSRDSFSLDVNSSLKWNQLIFTYILDALMPSDSKVKKITSSKINHEKFKVPSIKIKSIIRKILVHFLERLSLLFNFNNAIIINNPYIGAVGYLKLIIKLKKIPFLYNCRKFNSPQKTITLKRNFKLKKNGRESTLESIIKDLIPHQIPKCYLEDWDLLNDELSKLNLPKSALVIYTCSGIPSDEVFRLYIARKHMSGTKYCISQHGGVYGTMVVPPKAEFVEHRVADKWFSWGWQKKGFENVVPGLNLKNCTTSYVSKRSDGNLLISLPTLRYCPVRIVYNNHNEITSQIGKFISDLNNVFPDKIVIRANPNQKKSDITRTIPSSFKLSKTKKFWDEMSQSRLFVCLNNSTTVLEALSMNFPTVLIFTGAEALFREESKPYFKLLHEARILHFSYSSAVEHIDLIWNDVDNWWNEINLQDSRKKFCSNYSNTNSGWDGLLANFIMSCN